MNTTPQSGKVKVRPKAKPKVVKKVIPKAFIVEIVLNGKTLSGQGDTVLEALSSIERPSKIMNKMHLTIRHGDKKKELLFMPVRGKRLFYPYAQPYLAKYLEIGMK